MRFLGYVALPGAVLIGVLWWTTDVVSEDARAYGLSQMADASLSLLESDIHRATTRLAELATPWPDAAPDDPAVRMAAAGDTVRALRRRPDGIGISILIPAGAVFSTDPADTGPAVVARADGRLRSAIIERLPRLTGVSSAFYLDGEWLAGDSTAPGALMGEWTAAADAGGAEGAGIDLGEGTTARLLPAMGGPAATTALLVFDARPPLGPVARSARLLTAILLLFATGVVILGLGPGTRGEPAPRMAAAGLVLFAVTLVGSIGWAVSRTMEVERETSVRDLSRIGALLRDYGRVDDPAAAERLTGYRVLRISADGGIATSDGTPIPPGAAAIPSPPPNFPATGRLAGSNELYLVLRGEGGRTVLLRPDRASALPAVEAGVGGLLLLFGVWAFLRGGFSAGRDEKDSAVSS